MTTLVAAKPVRIQPANLYVEPISACNLHCRMCYTNVINGADKRVVPAETVLDFVRRFVAQADEQVSLYWCGTGEVFLHRDFPQMVNRLLADFDEPALTQTIQTNGTIKRLRAGDGAVILMRRRVVLDLIAQPGVVDLLLADPLLADQACSHACTSRHPRRWPGGAAGASRSRRLRSLYRFTGSGCWRSCADRCRWRSTRASASSGRTS